jgi:Fusaric acid resistance protein-like
MQLTKNKDAKGSLHSLLGFSDGEWRWSAGVQGALGGALPFAAFTLTGHQSLGLIASLGAFTVLYGSTLKLGDRLRALPLVAMGFVTASVLGVLCSTDVWLSIACLVTVAAVACVILFGVGLGPPGPMQFVLVAGVSGHLAALKRLSVSSSDVFAIPALVAAGAFGAYLIVVLLLALPLMRKAEGEGDRLRARFLPIWRNTEKATIATRAVVAVATASLLSFPLGVHHAYWTVMVAGAVLQTSHVSRHGAIRAMHRVLGTILGVAIFDLIKLAEPRGFWLVVVLALLQFSIEVVVARHYALALTFITPTALIISAAGGTADTVALVAERLLDTLLGSAIAMAVLWTSEWVRRH